MTDTPSLAVTPLPRFLSDPPLATIFAVLPEARLVGGAVRDLLAGLPVSDIDLATPRAPDAVMQTLLDAGLRAIPTGLDHGTVTAVVAGTPVEITTLRRDVETDGRRAVVAFTDDWRVDAARRDFTINALSMTRDGLVFDYFGGIDDLRRGRVRFVGDPSARIAEDYLRIMRYFRFHARYGKEPPDATTVAAIRGGLAGLATLSPERVWMELKRLLATPDPSAAVALMAKLGVLDSVLPEGADPVALTRLTLADALSDPLLRLAALLTGDAESLSDRLKLSNDERERLAALLAGPVPRPDDDNAALRRLLADTEPAILIDRAWLAGGDAREWAALRARLAAIPRPVFPLEGRDVLALGVLPGPRVGELLRAVRAWWLEGGCIADADACRARLDSLVRS